jgi:hypothetical protein
LRDKEVKALGKALMGEDTLEGLRAAWRLALATDQAMPWLKQHLQPVEVDADLQRLVRDLGSARFEVRERATKELAALGEKAGDALRDVLVAGTDLEQRRRAERLLRQFQDRPGTNREWRCAGLLAQMNTHEARQLLRKLAGGSPGALLTREAKRALERLESRAAGREATPAQRRPGG